MYIRNINIIFTNKNVVVANVQRKHSSNSLAFILTNISSTLHL